VLTHCQSLRNAGVVGLGLRADVVVVREVAVAMPPTAVVILVAYGGVYVLPS